ncbi:MULTISPECIES: transcription antitermination factor NusB [Streptomyces]|uniref:transcription antitermination factor NusB n=1 Tax=Streptomyces TaxID=1883 RepID=UPI0015914F03|nr:MULTISPECIES: transcription antitermination factor NusB [Streptomyces]QKV67755.1 transcription antitermination factor NusB [Streptomyces harbinensis]
MSARSKARQRALQILFEADQRAADPTDVLAEWTRKALSDQGNPQVNPYTRELVEGFAGRAERIDELLTQYTIGWPLDRMPAVDRNILRLSAFELIWRDDVPDPVVLDEAVQLARQFSTDDSPAFVNGLLGRLKELKPSLRR